MSFQNTIDIIFNKYPNLKEDVEKLREWTKKQPHLPETDDFLLSMFLHSCYFSLEQAKKTMDIYLTVKTICTDMFFWKGIDTINRASIAAFMRILPQTTDNNCNVLVAGLLDFDSNKFNANEQAYQMDYTFTAHHLEYGPMDGLLIVVDAKGATLGHLTKFTPTLIKQYAFYVQEAAPVRIKQIHIINANPIAEKLISIAKAFIKADIFQLIHLHKNIEGLFKFVPQRILPQEYGGEAPSIHDLQKQNLKDMEKYSDQFYYLNTLTVDESKRPGKPKTAGDLFGVDGTFKKLELD